MKKERLELLKEVYQYLVEENSLTVPYRISLDDLCCEGFNYQYLEMAGYIEFDDENGDPQKGFDLYLTVKGVDFVEANTPQPYTFDVEPWGIERAKYPCGCYVEEDN